MKRAALEFCVTDLQGAYIARQYGADRIELCTDLATGGLTPSFGLIKSCAAIIETHVLIRSRAGHFCYNQEEINLMVDDIEAAAQAGATGVVFGCLTEKQEIATGANQQMLEASRTNHLFPTFHRAFDRVITDQQSTLEQLIGLGFKRVLTSGRAPSALEGITVLEGWQKINEGRIQLMAGGGVGPENAAALLRVGVDALHCSIHQKEDVINPMGAQLRYNHAKVKEMRTIVNREDVWQA